MLKINAISECTHEPGEFISNVFLVPKPNGENRFILNLKSLNKYIKSNHFKMEDYRTAIKLITKQCYMASIDLKDSYFFVSVDKPHRKYLRFMYNDILYEFNCLPFGLCTAPFVFTKILKPVMEYLRSNNCLSVIYLDDILCIGKDYTDCKNNIMFTQSFLKYLGFILNEEKSNFNPSSQCKFLGFIFDSQNMTLNLPKTKTMKIINYIKLIRSKERCKLRDFARLVGLLVSSCPAIQYSWVYTKLFERFKFNKLCENPSYDQIVTLPNYLNCDFQWWLDHIEDGFCPLKTGQYCKEIYSDASTTGWGSYCDGMEASGHWKSDESSFHINVLELKAAFFGLKAFAKDCYNCEVLLRIDNVTAIACINRMGSVQYPHLNKITRDIWEWCESQGITIFASYINTKDNIEADFLSRKTFHDTEWELGDYAFRKITHKFGTPKVDLFANRCNSKCPVYVSWKSDPDAWAIDAFTIPWENLNFYAFPPFSVILKTLQKIINDKAEGIIVVPYWPTQPWFPLFRRLCSDIIYFEPNINLLKSPFRTVHSLHRTLTLAAARCSGKHY